MTAPTEADRDAAHRLIGCEAEAGCPHLGVCTVQYMNAQGPIWRACLGHAAPYRKNDNYAVRSFANPKRDWDWVTAYTLDDINAAAKRIAENAYNTLQSIADSKSELWGVVETKEKE